MPIYKGTSNTSIICPDRIRVCGGLLLLILVNLVPISPLRLRALENQKIKKNDSEFFLIVRVLTATTMHEPSLFVQHWAKKACRAAQRDSFCSGGINAIGGR